MSNKPLTIAPIWFEWTSPPDEERLTKDIDRLKVEFDNLNSRYYSITQFISNMKFKEEFENDPTMNLEVLWEYQKLILKDFHHVSQSIRTISKKLDTLKSGL